MAEVTETTLPIRRVTLTTEKAFDEVVAAVYSGLGRAPDFRALLERWSAARDRDEFDALVAGVAGSSGLIEFLSLDLGAALTMQDPEHGRRLLRIIAGNPVTMSRMTASVPDAGSYAPITILLAEVSAGTALSYDRIASAIAPYASPGASAVADALDDAVVRLLHDAAG